MSPVELLGLSLLVSVGVAGLGWLAASALEGVSGDVRLREGAWRAALFLPVLPLAAMALFLLTPAPVRTVSMLTAPAAEAAPMSLDLAGIVPATETFGLDGEQAAMVVLTASLALALLRLAVLGWRARRLGRLLASATTASSPTLQTVGDVARRLGLPTPEVRVFDGGSEALLTGLVRPVLVLPSSLAEASDDPAARAVIAHELAHLKRGDHRAVWGEEGLLVLLAFNPFLPFVRARRAAAREEACDALALRGAGAETRRAYARSLVEALRARADSSPTPALTFTGNPRSRAMRRLQSILTPPAAAGRSIRFAAMAAGIALLALTGLGTTAVASQAASSASSANTTRLTVEISQDKHPFILGSSDVLLVSLAGEAEGEALSKTWEVPILLGQGLPGRVFLDLDDRFFPSRMRARAYELKAEVRGANGRVAYASEPTTLRLAPRSQGRVARMRPQLILHPLS